MKYHEINQLNKQKKITKKWFVFPKQKLPSSYMNCRSYLKKAAQWSDWNMNQFSEQYLEIKLHKITQCTRKLVKTPDENTSEFILTLFWQFILTAEFILTFFFVNFDYQLFVFILNWLLLHAFSDNQMAMFLGILWEKKKTKKSKTKKTQTYRCRCP